MILPKPVVDPPPTASTASACTSCAEATARLTERAGTWATVSENVPKARGPRSGRRHRPLRRAPGGLRHRRRQRAAQPTRLAARSGWARVLSRRAPASCRTLRLSVLRRSVARAGGPVAVRLEVQLVLRVGGRSDRGQRSRNGVRVLQEGLGGVARVLPGGELQRDVVDRVLEVDRVAEPVVEITLDLDVVVLEQLFRLLQLALGRHSDREVVARSEQ